MIRTGMLIMLAALLIFAVKQIQAYMEFDPADSCFSSTLPCKDLAEDK